MDEILTAKELENKRKGQIAGGVMFILLIIVLLLPLFWYQNPPPGQEGIQVNLGIPDIGMGDDLNAPVATTSETEEVTEPDPEPVDPVEEVTAPPTPSDPEPPQRETVTTDDAEAIAQRRQREREAAEQRANSGGQTTYHIVVGKRAPAPRRRAPSPAGSCSTSYPRSGRRAV